MATWPSTLPAPQRPGYEIEPVHPSLRTGMEVGAARSRRITRARNDQVSVAWSLTDAQMAIFRDWFEDDAEAAGGRVNGRRRRWRRGALRRQTGGQPQQQQQNALEARENVGHHAKGQV